MNFLARLCNYLAIVFRQFAVGRVLLVLVAVFCTVELVAAKSTSDALILYDLSIGTAVVSDSSQNRLLDTNQLTNDWTTFFNEGYGYSITHPASFTVNEQRESANSTGVPSDVWIGSNMHIITRMPPLDDATIERYWGGADSLLLDSGIAAKRIERISLPQGGDTPVTSIEYMIRGDGVDYFLIYRLPGYEELEKSDDAAIYEMMVNSFELHPLKNSTSNETGVEADPADAFDFFVNPPNGGTRPNSSMSYNANNPALTAIAPCYNKRYYQLQHTAEDWLRAAGTNVHAVANGRVIYSANANYPGGVIIIEHKLGNGWKNPWGGDIIYSMYGHLKTDSLISQWSDVTRGQVIGNVLYQTGNSHIHFEMRRYGDMSNILKCPANGKSSWPGPGYTDAGVHPDTFGYTHPSSWIDNHREKGCPAPELTAPGNGETVKSRTVKMDWRTPDCSGLTGYTVHLTTGSGPEDGIIEHGDYGVDKDKSETTFTFPRDGKFYWHIAAWQDHTKRGPWSTRSFTIDTTQPPDCSIGPNQIALYAGTSYQVPCVVLNIGSYPKPGNLGSVGNDNAESIKVGSNVKATLFEHDDYNGRDSVFTANDINLGNDKIGGNSVSSVKVETRTPTSPPTLKSPANGHKYNEPDSVQLCWNSVANASEYYFEVTGGPSAIRPGWQSSTCKTLGPQWAGYEYSWHVKARNSSGETGWSSTWKFQVLPSAPTSLTARSVACDVNLSWKDNAGNEQGYRIYRDNSHIASVSANANSYQNKSLISGRTYNYAVRAYKNNILSNPSNTVAITPQCEFSNWKGEYFNNMTLSGNPVLVRDDPEINFDWGSASPGPGVNADRFSARWTKTVQLGSYGRYRFYLQHDDGIRLTIDGKIVAERWYDSSGSFSVDYAVPSAEERAFKLEMYENAWGAKAKLSWSLLPPDKPALFDIENDDGDGNYSVRLWRTLGAFDHKLEEQHDGGVWKTIIPWVFSPIGISKNVENQDSGTWCYRATARNDAGESEVSDSVCTQVTTQGLSSRATDIFWYGPGSKYDSLHIAIGNGKFRTETASINGTFTPLVGDFNGDYFDDVFWYGPGSLADSVHLAEGDGKFKRVGALIRGTYTPLVGDFNGDGKSDIYWYGPGAVHDALHLATGEGKFRSIKKIIGGKFIPLVGDFNGDRMDDIFWYGPGSDPDTLHLATGDGRFRSLRVTVRGTYTPLVGDFNGDRMDDIYWYGPGSRYDTLHLAIGGGKFRSHMVNIQGTYTPLLGDFNGDGKTDIFWYGPGPVHDALHLATRGGSFRSIKKNIGGRYTPLVGDFNGDSRDDIFWYGPGSAYDSLHLSRGDGRFAAKSWPINGRYTPLTGNFGY